MTFLLLLQEQLHFTEKNNLKVVFTFSSQKRAPSRKVKNLFTPKLVDLFSIKARRA